MIIILVILIMMCMIIINNSETYDNSHHHDNNSENVYMSLSLSLYIHIYIYIYVYIHMYYIHMYIYIYIYMYTYTTMPSARGRLPTLREPERTTIWHSDDNTTMPSALRDRRMASNSRRPESQFPRVGILMSIGDSQEVLSQQILAWVIVVGRRGVQEQWVFGTRASYRRTNIFQQGPAGQRKRGGKFWEPPCMLEPLFVSARHGSENPGFVLRPLSPYMPLPLWALLNGSWLRSTSSETLCVVQIVPDMFRFYPEARMRNRILRASFRPLKPWSMDLGIIFPAGVYFTSISCFHKLSVINCFLRAIFSPLKLWAMRGADWTNTCLLWAGTSSIRLILQYY